MAEERKTLAQLVADLQRDFGAHYYGRRDMHISDDIKKSAIARASNGMRRLGRYNVERTADLDGIKLYLDAPRDNNGADAWLLMRASGTEPLLRVYCEASSPKLVEEILGEAERFVME